MNKKLFLVALTTFSTAFLKADHRPFRAIHSGIPRFFGMTKDNQELYITNAIIYALDLNDLQKDLRNGTIANPQNREKALTKLNCDIISSEDITNNLNECYHQNTQQGLDQAANNTKKALDQHHRKGKPRVTGLYMTLKGYSTLGRHHF